MIRFLSDYGFDAYMYAPKDDPYHRALWREDYPESLSIKLRELVEASNLYSVDFIFTVSPGLSVKYSDRKELDLLLKKLRTAVDMGCRWIGVLLDDIDTELRFEEDRKAFSTLARAHAYLVNATREELQKNQNVRVSFCPTYYANDYLGKSVRDNEYLSEIGTEMRNDIDVLWTGRHVVSAKITEADVLEYEKVVRRKPLLWDNYPVNDYFRSDERDLGLRLNLGPFARREPRVLDHLAGYLSNPMNESEASKISLVTLIDMLENPQGYSPTDSMERALDRLFGTSSRARGEMRILIEAAKASPFDPDEAVELKRLVDRAISSYGKSLEEEWQLNESALRSHLEDCFALKENLRSNLQNKKLYFELEPVLSKLKKYAMLGTKSLDYVDTVRSNKRDADSITKAELDLAAEEVKKDKIQVLGEINFGTHSDLRNETYDTDDVSALGIPYFRSESPVMKLYEWARELHPL